MDKEKILIADDSYFMRSIIKNMLFKNELSVAGEAENGLEAVIKYKELSPDILIMDITMSSMTGLEALKAIKQEFPQAKIIMCSAMGQEPYVKEALALGACDFLVKPIEESRLITAIKRVCTNR